MDYLYLYSDAEKKMNVFLDVKQNEIVTFGDDDKPSTKGFKASVGSIFFLSVLIRNFGKSFLIDKTSMLIVFILVCCGGFIFQGWIIEKNIKKNMLENKRILSMTDTEILLFFKKRIFENYKI